MVGLRTSGYVRWVCHLACWCVTVSLYWASRSSGSWLFCHLGPIWFQCRWRVLRLCHSFKCCARRCPLPFHLGWKMFSSLTIANILELEGGFLDSSDSKEPACNAGALGSILGSGRSPREGNGNSLQYSCLEKSHGWRTLVDYSPWSPKELDMTERLHFNFAKWFLDHSYSETKVGKCLQRTNEMIHYSKC